MRHAQGSKTAIGPKLGDILLTLAAVGGVLCILLVILASFFHVTLIMFKTGSMSPTIPAGSLAVVREVPAAEIAVGDIVTVDRPGALPVTHRVTSIVAAHGESRTITLRGDANPVEDPAPYSVTSVRSVLWSVPGLAQVVVWMSNPLVLGTVTIAASLLVTWAFWPRDARQKRQRFPTVAAIAIIAALGAPVVAAPQAARAAEVDTLITGNVIRLLTVADSVKLAHLVPGEEVPWQVGVWARAGTTGDIELSLSASGALAQDPEGLQVEIRICNVRWAAGACGSGEAPVAGPGPASAVLGVPVTWSGMEATDERWLYVNVWLPSNLSVLPTTTASLRLTASGSGDSLATDSAGLATSGTDSALPLTLATGSVALGLLFAMLARARRNRTVLP